MNELSIEEYNKYENHYDTFIQDESFFKEYNVLNYLFNHYFSKFKSEAYQCKKDNLNVLNKFTRKITNMFYNVFKSKSFKYKSKICYLFGIRMKFIRQLYATKKYDENAYYVETISFYESGKQIIYFQNLFEYLEEFFIFQINEKKKKNKSNNIFKNIFFKKNETRDVLFESEYIKFHVNKYDLLPFMK
jgi:hypothetical protein